MGIKIIHKGLPVEQWIYKKIEQQKEQLINTLKYIGVDAQRTARLNGKYKDLSGNLRSSIGYCIVLDGVIVDRAYFAVVKGGEQGAEAGNACVEQIAQEHQTGLHLVVFAGMPYASAVEARGYDVLDSAEIKATQEVREKLKNLQVTINRN